MRLAIILSIILAIILSIIIYVLVYLKEFSTLSYLIIFLVIYAINTHPSNHICSIYDCEDKEVKPKCSCCKYRYQFIGNLILFTTFFVGLVNQIKGNTIINNIIIIILITLGSMLYISDDPFISILSLINPMLAAYVMKHNKNKECIYGSATRFYDKVADSLK